MKKNIIIALCLWSLNSNAQTLTETDKRSIVQQVKKEILDSLKLQTNSKIDTTDTELPKVNKQFGEPFEGLDMSWANGSDRRTKNIWKDNQFFVPSILVDVNYNYSFNNPIDNTAIGSKAVARHNEVQIAALHFGGDFYYKNARARIMTQFGTRSVVIPRNDYSPYRGQYKLNDD